MASVNTAGTDMRRASHSEWGLFITTNIGVKMKNQKNIIIVVVATIAVVLACCCGGLLLALADNEPDTTVATSTTTTATPSSPTVSSSPTAKATPSSPATKAAPYSPTAKATPSGGDDNEQLYADFIRDALGVGYEISDEQIIDIGKNVCVAFDSGVSFEEVGSLFLNEGMSPEDAGTIIGAAIPAFCPQHSDVVQQGV